MLILIRRNTKEQIVSNEDVIKKSNEFSMSKLNHGLTLNQTQLLAYAIYSTQQDGETTFIKADFEKRFELKRYKTKDAFIDSDRVSALRFSSEDLENDRFRFTPVFSDFQYDKGTFNIEWNPKFLPHILELKDKYVLTDLTITSKFKSSFSWVLYEYLKALYGYWSKELSKEAIMKLFNVEDKKTYQKNTAQFKRAVLDVAISELNEYTELKVWYTEKKKGRAIVGFEIHWSTGKCESGVTDKQAALLREIHKEVEERLFDYLALKNENNLSLARGYILRLKEINEQVSPDLTAKQADEFIREAKELYKQLQCLLEQDGQKRDTSVYFNWLEEE